MGMRFYIFPAAEGKTTCINFDHVTNIRIDATTIELYFVGVEVPMVVAKSPGTLSTIAKGMDLSEGSKDQINSL